MIEAKPSDYWISKRALSISLNALGEADRIQASVASGASILAYVKGIKSEAEGGEAGNGDGLEYDVAHNYRRWPLVISPTFFNTHSRKYIYAAIPRKPEVATDAMIVFPSEKIDIYGRSESGTPTHDPDYTEFSSLVSYFNAISGVTVPSSGTLYDYLRSLYGEAYLQYYYQESQLGLPILYKQSNFPTVYDYYGEGKSSDTSFKVMTAWLTAMVLSELVPKKRDIIFKQAYNYAGNGKDDPTFGNTFESDYNVSRMVASVIYGATRDATKIATMRTEAGGSTITYQTSIYDVLVDTRGFMPSAAGPYLSDYDVKSRTGMNPNGQYPGGYPTGDKDAADHNLQRDKQIHQYVSDTYSLASPNAAIKQRTVQAIADKEYNVQHLFGAAHSVTDKDYGVLTFNPVFGAHNLGFEIPVNGAIASLISAVTPAFSNTRESLLQQQYGRRRPGQGATDNSYNPVESERVLVNYAIEESDGKTTGYYNANGTYTYDENRDYDDYVAYYQQKVSANSYPSGHSAHIFGIAVVLAEVMPDKADIIMKAANDFALSRVITRYHWTSDTIHGRVIGSVMVPVEHALTNINYASLLSAAKAEYASLNSANTRSASRSATSAQTQLGSDDYFYIFLQGVISSSGSDGNTARYWEQFIDTGNLSTDEALAVSGEDLFLSKLHDDTAEGFITMLQGLQVGDRFVSGLMGEGGVFRRESDGTTYLEADRLYIRMKAYFDTVEIRRYLHSGGNRIASAAGVKCIRVLYLNTSGESVADPTIAVKFRCFFRADDGQDEITNDFVKGDMAYCHVTNMVSSSDMYQHRYWRLVVEKSSSINADGEHWIDLSNKSSETISIDGTSYTRKGYMDDSDVPAVQDDIIQLGHISNTERRGAIVEYVSGSDSPSYQIYQGIGSDSPNPFVLTGKNYINIGYNSQTGHARMNVAGDFRFGAQTDNGGSYIKYNQDTHHMVVKAEVTFLSPDGSGGYVDTTMDEFAAAIQQSIDDLQDQIDGQIETWFYDYVPTLQNAPAKGWSTTERKNHLGDLFYNTETGYGYRFANTGTESSPVFEWLRITDTDVVKALADAAKAQDTADHKRRVFLTTPTIPYDAGDLWVNAVWPASGADQGTIYNDDILRCLVSKTTGSFDIADWGLASKYTDDSSLNTFLSTTYLDDKDTMQGLIDQKAETWYQPTNPATAWTTDTLSKHVGDIWCDTSANGGKKTYIYVDKGEGENPRYDWSEQSVPDEVFDEIDGKATIYVNDPNISCPTDYHANDLWILPVAATINGTAYKQGEVLTATQDSVTYNQAHWTKKVCYTDDTELNNFKANQYVAALTSGQMSTDIANAATNYQNDAVLNAMKVALGGALGGATLVDGGLMLTSLINLRQFNGSSGQEGDITKYTTWAGVSGVYNPKTESQTGGAKGHGIAAWYGGDMVDYEMLTSTQQQQPWNVFRYARTLFRFDGSGYVAGGNISWSADGTPTIKGTKITALDHLYIGNVEVKLDNFVTITGVETITGAKTFSSLLTANGGIVTNKLYLYKPNSDDTDAVYFVKDSNGVRLAGAGFYSDSFISALGVSSGGGGSIIDLNQPLSGINSAGLSAPSQSGQALVYNGSAWEYSNRTSLTVGSNMTVGGTISATGISVGSGYGFRISGSTNDYVLLAGGGTKALSDIGGGGDVSSITVGTTNYTPTNGIVTLPDYLPLTGGILTLSGVNSFTVRRNDADHTNTFIRFQGKIDGTDNTTMGYLGFSAKDTPSYRTSGGTNRTLWHSGNFNPDNYLPLAGGTMANTNLVTNMNADLLDGKHNGEVTSRFVNRVSNSTNPSNANSIGGGLMRNYGSSSYWQNAPSGMSYGSIYEITDSADDNLMAQFAWDVSHNEAGSTRYLWFRANNNLGWEQSTWKRIAWASELSNYLPLAGGTITGSITLSQTSSNRRVGLVGTYDPDRVAAIWAMGSSYQIAADGLTFGSLYGAAYAYFSSGHTFTGYSGGHSFVWAQAGTIYAALGNSIWSKGGFIKDGSSSAYVLTGDGGHAQISGLSVSYASSAGNADTVDNYHASSFAFQQADNNLINHTNEFTFVGSGYNSTIWFNYRTTGGQNGNIQGYYFGNGKGGAIASIDASGNYSGNAATATTASKLSAVSKTAWGQTYWTSGGVPDSISGNMTSVGDISFSATGKNIGGLIYFDTTNSRVGVGTSSPSYKLHVNGTLGVASGITLTTTKKIYFGDSSHYIELDSTGFHFSHGIYSDSFISAMGASSGGGSSISLNQPLSGINSAGLSAPSSSGQAVVYNGSTWVYSGSTTLKTNALSVSSSISAYTGSFGSSLDVAANLTIAAGNLVVTNGSAAIGGSVSSSYKLRVYGIGRFNDLAIGENTDVTSSHINACKIEAKNKAIYLVSASNLSIYATGSYSNISDIRLKNIVSNVGSSVEDIANAPIFNFTWRGVESPNVFLGSSAQYWQKYLPHAVTTAPNGYLSMDYSAIALAAAVITARKVVTHEDEILSLKRRVKELEDELATIKAA